MKGLKWFFAEFLVVVTGVLVAFALNSWWVGLKDDQKEEIYLKQVIQDIDLSIELMNGAVDFQKATAQNTAGLLESFYRDSLESDQILNQYALGAMSFEPGGIIQSTLLSLVNSGDLQLITSDSIRQELTELSGKLQSYENSRKTVTTEMLFPAFKELAAIVSPFDISFALLDSTTYIQATADSLVPLPELANYKMPEYFDWNEMADNDKLREKVAYMYFAQVNLLRTHKSGLDVLEASRARLDSLVAY